MCVSLYKKAEFSPWGPKPNWCYVTETKVSHPDAESPESLQAAGLTQVRTVNMEYAVISAVQILRKKAFGADF